MAIFFECSSIPNRADAPNPNDIDASAVGLSAFAVQGKRVYAAYTRSDAFIWALRDAGSETINYESVIECGGIALDLHLSILGDSRVGTLRGLLGTKSIPGLLLEIK